MFRREEEESIFKKRLLYDGHGSGEDKRLVNLMKHITRFFLTEDSSEDTNKLFNTISKDFTAAINAAEKHEKISQMYDRTFLILDKAIEEKAEHFERVKSELVNLELDLEYVEKLRRVNAHPDCMTTAKTMQDIKRKKRQLMEKMANQKSNLRTLAEVCQNLQKVLEDDEEKEAEHECLMLPDSDL